jgi:hypothetical protein
MVQSFYGTVVYHWIICLSLIKGDLLPVQEQGVQWVYDFASIRPPWFTCSFNSPVLVNKNDLMLTAENSGKRFYII